MKWFKDNPFLAGLIAVTVIGAGALAYFLSDALSRYQETTDGYTQAVQKLHDLQGQSPFPSVQNLAKSRAVAAEYKTGVNDLRKRLAAMQLPMDPAITAQQFDDNLRKAVNETVEKAKQAEVTLPKDFYLGFNPYATSLPSEQAAPYLARQLTLIEQMVQQLIDLKIQSLDQLDRPPIAQENAATATPAAPSAPAAPAGRGRKPAAPPSDLFSTQTVDLAFTAEQGKFRVAFNSLLDHSQFLIIRTLEVQNSNPSPPPMVSSTPTAGPVVPLPMGGPPNNPINMAAPGNPAGASAPSDDLDVILGRELVKATLQIDILNFSAPEPEATPAPTKPEAK